VSDGAELEQPAYADLFATIGTAYGAAVQPITHFLLPDLRGNVAAGVQAVGGEGGLAGTLALGEKQGVEEVALDEAAIPAHNHDAASAAAGDHQHDVDQWTRSAQAVNSNSKTPNFSVVSNGNHNHTLAIHQSGAYASGNVGANQMGGGPETTSSSGSHNHSLSGGSHNHSTTVPDQSHIHGMQDAGDHSHNVTTEETGGGGSHTNVQPMIGLNYIIKY